MKQPKDSLFFQSALYVAELCEPMTVVQFLEEEHQDASSPKSTHRHHVEKLEKLEQINEQPPKIFRRQKNEPYHSDWAQSVLAKQFGVQLNQISQTVSVSPKWRLLKVKAPDLTGVQGVTDKQVVKDFKSQERLFQETASKANRGKIDKIIKQYKQSFNGPVGNHNTAQYSSKLPSI